MLGMAPAWWARIAPDRLAIIAPSGNRSYGELNARANQLVRVFATPGWPRATVSRCCAPTAPSSPRSWAAMPARGGFRLTPVNWHLTADEAAYIVGDCEAKAFVADAAIAAIAARGAAAGAATRRCALAVGGAIDGFDAVRRRRSRRERRRRHRRPDARHDDALHVGHDRATRRASHRPADPDARTCGAHRRTATTATATCTCAPARSTTPRRSRSRSTLPLRAGVPRRADGRVGRRGDAAPHRGAPRHPHAHGADDVPPPARAARRRARARTTSRRCATSCTARRRARCR